MNKIIPIVALVYTLTVLLTPISFTGYWVDIVLSITLAVASIYISFRNRRVRILPVVKGLALVNSLIVFGLLGLHLAIPFLWSAGKVKKFGEQEVDNRKFQAYFKPVGAWGSGFGDLWITESPKYLPFIELTVYEESPTHYDFGADFFEETPVDQIVKSYIIQDVLNK